MKFRFCRRILDISGQELLKGLVPTSDITIVITIIMFMVVMSPAGTKPYSLYYLFLHYKPGWQRSVKLFPPE